MRITGISTHVAGTPWRNLTFVQVHTDEGLVGVGEARMLNHTDALIGYLAEAEVNHIKGSDPFDTEDLVHRMKYGDYGRAGEIVMSGIACVEMACWDIVGKALGQPVWRLLGGKVRDRIKAYANGWYTVERTPEAFHEAAKQVVERGYQVLNLDTKRLDDPEVRTLITDITDSGQVFNALSSYMGLHEFDPSLTPQPWSPDALRAAYRDFDRAMGRTLAAVVHR